MRTPSFRTPTLRRPSLRGMSFRDRDPIAVGLVSSLVLVLLVVTVFFTGTMGLLQDRYSMSGVFTGTGGIRSGDEVRVAGVRVGEVTGVHPDFRNGQVIIDWKVDSKVHLGTATRAEIKTATILGGRYLKLSGPVSTPYVQSLPASRRRIPADRTGTPETVNDVLKRTTHAVDKLDTADLNKVIDQIGGINDQTRGRLGHSLKNLSALASEVDENDPKIRELLENGDHVLGIAADKDQQLSQLLQGAQAMLAELRRRRDELTTFLGSGSAALGSISQLIDKQQAKLVSVVADLRSTLSRLRPELGSLNSLLTWAGPTLSGMSSVGGYGPWVEAIATGLGPLSPGDLARLAAASPKGGS
ncbi:MCE family protein [Actinomadura barringtoniae]|uniref:MCE family protein n=1 Tax=Actinomadura barringtoniae TaxID=1427535 RepID=A0A939PE63_9ACTN|nr:MlaD family protein [Actinomadura barringtoniae]MBO2447589.1 MCE family protein [Actinomadura barringtoniae]